MSDLKTLETPKKPDAPEVAPPPPASKGGRWPWLIAPLMGISVILHIALLFMPLPVPENPLEEVEAETPPEEAEETPIDILSLSEIAAPEPPPPESPQPQPPAQPEPPPPSGAVPPPPDPAQVEERPSEPIDVEAELPVEDGLVEETPPPFDAGAATDQFVGDLSGLGVVDYTSQFGLPTPDFLRNPGNAVCFIDPAGGPVSGVRVANWLDKEPQTLLRENLKDVYEPRGITFEELDAFCGERYFQAYTADGQPFMTFSLVTLEGSTLLVVWEIPPQ
jgi:hypothetical protein